MSNYPPGVTGNEYQIAGPDFEEERDELCPLGHSPILVLGYRDEIWAYCFEQSCLYFEGNLDSISFTPRKYTNYYDGRDGSIEISEEEETKLIYCGYKDAFGGPCILPAGHEFPRTRKGIVHNDGKLLYR